MTPPVRKKKPAFEIGVNLRVTQCFDKGGRNYMEDFSKYYFEKDPQSNQSVVFAFFGVFDGHGGTEAACLAHECLLDEIKGQDEFWSNDDDTVLQAIRHGFLRTHKRMVEERDKWPLTPSGFKSTAGTTASIAIIRNRKLYVGHVGDSAVVMGYCGADSKDATTDNWNGSALTVEHKPDHPDERRRIEAHGGAVRRKAGIHRVVWNRPKTSKPHAAASSTTPAVAEFEEIPFLAVARSLGDLWSFDPETQQYHVSPEPDITVYELRPGEDRCLIIGSDGLWNVMRPETAVELVRLCERETESRVFADAGVAPSFFYHPAGTLVQFALERCMQRNVRADNVTALVVMIDPPGKPMTQLRQERRRLLFSRLGMEDGTADDRSIRRLLVESQSAVGKDACSSPPITSKTEPNPDLEISPVLRSPRAKSMPVLSVLRNTLQGPSGFPSLVEAWTEPCWKEMLAYCRQFGLADPPFEPQALLNHLMDMDAKYRKEALQAVPTVLSMKKAFSRDNEMTVCLNQIPLLSREWTQLLVMSSSNPGSPTSPSCTSLSPPLLSPVGPPSPPACKRWVERREKILSHIYQMLGRRLPNELTKDVQECMKQHVAREVSQRMRISRPHDLPPEEPEERMRTLASRIEEEEERSMRSKRGVDEPIRKRRLTRGSEAEDKRIFEEMEKRKDHRPSRRSEENTERIDDKRLTRRTDEKEVEKSKEKRPSRIEAEKEIQKMRDKRPSRLEAEREKDKRPSRIEAEREKDKRPSRIEAEKEKDKRPSRIEAEKEKDKRPSRIEAEREKDKRPSRIEAEKEVEKGDEKRLTRTSEAEKVAERRATRGIESLDERKRRLTRGTENEEGENKRPISIRGQEELDAVNGNASSSPIKPALRRVGRQKSVPRVRSQSESIVESTPSPTEETPSKIAVGSEDMPWRQVMENAYPLGPVVTPWSSLPLKQRRSGSMKEDEKAVEELMDKLVVVVQPSADFLMNQSTKTKEEEAPKPRPIILPARKQPKPKPQAATVQRKRKSESDVVPEKKQHKISEELMKCSTYKAFYQRIVTDELAEARLEEVMKSVKRLSPSPPLSAKPLVIEHSPNTNTVSVSSTEAKRRRVEPETSDKAPPPPSTSEVIVRAEVQPSDCSEPSSGRRSLRLRSNKST